MDKFSAQNPGSQASYQAPLCFSCILKNKQTTGNRFTGLENELTVTNGGRVRGRDS